MSKLKKAFKNLGKKIAVVSIVMLGLQVVLAAGAMPAKTFAATPVKEATTVTPANHVVISEVQAGQTGSADNEFVELYNPTAVDINLQKEGLVLHIRNSAGTDSNKPLAFTSSVIKSNGFFLIAPNNSYATIIGADATYADSGNLLVANGSASVSYTGGNDMVGWGTQPVGGYEGIAYNPSIPADQSIERRANASSTPVTMAVGGSDALKGNAYDSNNNASDFVARAIPDPQNSQSPIEDIIAPSVTVNSLTTNIATPTVTGTIKDNGTVKSVVVEVNGKSYKAAVAGTNWSAAVIDSLTDGTYDVIASATDANYNIGLDKTNNELTIDKVAPTFKTTTNPTVAGPGVKTVDITVKSKEALQASQIDPKSKKNYEMALTINEVDGSPTTVYLNHDPSDLSGTTFTYAYTIQTIAQNKDVSLTVTGEDLAGNTTTGYQAGNFKVDNMVLSPVVQTPAAPAVTEAVATTPVNETYGSDASSSQGEVKAATIKPADQKPADNKNQKTETKGKQSIPLWGIIFLLILAGIGGYLFYVQGPTQQTVKPATKSRPRPRKKK